MTESMAKTSLRIFEPSRPSLFNSFERKFQPRNGWRFAARSLFRLRSSRSSIVSEKRWRNLFLPTREMQPPVQFDNSIQRSLQSDPSKFISMAWAKSQVVLLIPNGKFLRPFQNGASGRILMSGNVKALKSPRLLP